MPVASFLRPQPQLLQPEFVPTSVVKGALKTINNTQRKQRRRVQFKESVSVRPINHVLDMCPDEIADVWFNKAEFSVMKRAMAVTVALMTAGAQLDDEHCSRGLEFRTRAGASQRRLNKANARDAVLDEQDRQMAHGVINDEAISEVFIRENLHTRLAALERGIADQEEARSLDDDVEDLDDFDLFDNDYSSDDEMDYGFDRMSLMAAPRSRYTTASFGDRMELE